MIIKPSYGSNIDGQHLSGHYILGAITAPDLIKSMTDLISIQIYTHDIPPIRSAPGPERMKEQIARAQIVESRFSSVWEDAKWALWTHLPDLVDFNTLSNEALSNFTRDYEDEVDNRSDWEEWYTWDDAEHAEMEADYNRVKQTSDAIKAVIKQRTTGYVYLLKSDSGHWKIGKTVNPDDRMKTFSVKLPFEVQYEHIIPCQNHHWAEDTLHFKYASKRVNGEWFNLEHWEVDDIKLIRFM